MADPPEPAPSLAKRLQEVVGSVSSVVAPITLISAILFYFGYVYTTTEYGYFGLDVDTIGLSTQEFIMRSPGPLRRPHPRGADGRRGARLVPVRVTPARQRRRVKAASRLPSSGSSSGDSPPVASARPMQRGPSNRPQAYRTEVSSSSTTPTRSWWMAG
jgi:hypothetical protein